MRRRLGDVLARQWALYGLLLSTGFAAMALLLLFLLEDAFIDRRLHEVGAGAASAATTLPPGFTRIDRAGAPAGLQARTRGQREGVVREFRLDDGRYVHVLAATGADGVPFLLVYDVSDQLHVNQALARAWPGLLAIFAALAAAAWLLARRFVARLEKQSGALLRALADADDPGRLDALAVDEPIAEFAQFATLAAAAWRQRLQALARERETLAFLGHELRTPLQSARTSLALLQEDRDDAGAWRRLRRAQDRLVRASQAVLWLAGDEAPLPQATCDASALLARLADEFAPLAAARAQAIAVQVDAATSWPLPEELAETVLANLLLNAVQHGGSGTIAVAADAGGVRIGNPSGAGGGDGFGLGLEIVRRLLQRVGATLRCDADGGSVVAEVRWDAR